MQPRIEYPRPQMVRDNWTNLNGEWGFEFDDLNQGLDSEWYCKEEFAEKIIVPYAYQTKLSGINLQEFHDIVWYQREWKLDKKREGKKWILHFGAVDYSSQLWVNGKYVGEHQGGHISFSYDITRFITQGSNDIILRVQDYAYDLELPRGKQYWKEQSESIFYTPTTGIWQTVWIEEVTESYLKKIWMTPDIDTKSIEVEYEVETNTHKLDMNVQISLENNILVQDKVSVINGRGKRSFRLDQSIANVWQFYEMWTWTPERPILFDITFDLITEGGDVDHVESYFGMRKISIVDGKFMLNNRPYYQKMLLDQGYWEESLLTAPTDNHFIEDIRLCKEMGFNGVRKHQKIEDPRFLYHADRMGFLVWGEIASAYVYSRNYAKRMTQEWMEMIERDYNHPSIIAWTPLNESWGIDGVMYNKEEQSHSKAMYHITKSLDQTRPVISNDGWDHTESDLFTIHDYASDKEELKDRYKDLASILSSRPASRSLFAQNHEYKGQPVIVSEFGGISYKKGKWSGWGYSCAESDEDFIDRYYKVISALLESPIVQGFVYTQITDVEQEINGLLTYAREPKVDLSIIRSINEGSFDL